MRSVSMLSLLTHGTTRRSEVVNFSNVQRMGEGHSMWVGSNVWDKVSTMGLKPTGAETMTAVLYLKLIRNGAEGSCSEEIFLERMGNEKLLRTQGGRVSGCVTIEMWARPFLVLRRSIRREWHECRFETHKPNNPMRIIYYTLRIPF